MILNDYKKKPTIAIYKPNNKALAEFAQLFNIKKRESYSDLQDYITSIIVYFDKKAVMIREISRNNYTSFNNMLNAMKKQSTNYPISGECIINIPNKIFNNIPDIKKIPLVLITSAKWNPKDADRFHMYNNLNSGMYNNLVKKITSGKANKIVNISNMQVSNEVTCKTSEELLDNLNKIQYPYQDIDYILKYIQSVKDLFNVYKNLPIEGDDKMSYQIKLMKSFIQMENLCTYHKTIVNILTQVYTAKLNSFSWKASKSTLNETTMVNELFNDHSCLYEVEAYSENGLDINNMISNNTENNRVEQLNTLNYLKEYITNLYNTTKGAIDHHGQDGIFYYTFDNNDLKTFLENVPTGISDDQIESYIKKLSSYNFKNIKSYDIKEDLVYKHRQKLIEVLYVEYSIIIKDLEYYISIYNDPLYINEKNNNVFSHIFDRGYKDIALFAKIEMDNLLYEILNHKDFNLVKEKYSYWGGIQCAGQYANENHMIILKILLDNDKYELYDLVKRYFNTIGCFKDNHNSLYNDMIWDFEQYKEGHNINTLPELSKWLLMAILHFQRKCSLI